MMMFWIRIRLSLGGQGRSKNAWQRVRCAAEEGPGFDRSSLKERRKVEDQ